MFSLCIVETEIWNLLNDSCKLLNSKRSNFLLSARPQGELWECCVFSADLKELCSCSELGVRIVWAAAFYSNNSENIFNCVSRKLFSSATWEQQLKYSRTLPSQVVLFQMMSVMASAVKAVTKVKALFLPLVWKSDEDRGCSCPLVSCHVPQLEEDTHIFK